MLRAASWAAGLRCRRSGRRGPDSGRRTARWWPGHGPRNRAGTSPCRRSRRLRSRYRPWASPALFARRRRKRPRRRRKLPLTRQRSRSRSMAPPSVRMSRLGYSELDQPGRRYRSMPTRGSVSSMLSRRDVLLGSGCTLAPFTARARADRTPDGFTVLRASAAGFDGAVPGPVIRARRGDEVKVRRANGLDEATALHWHGVRLPNAMDGGSPLTGPPVPPGASVDYPFTGPAAGTFWYRAMRRDQQERGLHGALIVEEPAPQQVDRDQPLPFADRRDGDATRQFTLNGAAAVDIPARPNERLRLRFINASATQAMNARIDRHRVFVMALDGEPAEPFVSRASRLSLGPGNRADVFVPATRPSVTIAPVP